MGFLRKFRFGGCLADDMGLGKTICALALLESRRASKAGPSLVVVPRSLMFNWKAEAARFAPSLRVLDFTGSGRALGEADLVLTTYGTLRRDALRLKDVRFDYVILDEAQAIDRTHRIGQAKNVFAYRLVARDTVEEKVIELQKSKRELAEAILMEDRSLLRGLSRDDLELLLS